MYVKLIQLI